MQNLQRFATTGNEIESVNIEALKQLEKNGKTVHPAPSALKIIKDKGLCVRSLRREHDSKFCNKYCRYCKDYHHISICFKLAKNALQYT